MIMRLLSSINLREIAEIEKKKRFTLKELEKLFTQVDHFMFHSEMRSHTHNLHFISARARDKKSADMQRVCAQEEVN